MNLKEKIEQDLKEAQKKNEEIRVSTLRLLSAALHNREIDKRTKLARSTASTDSPQASLGQASPGELEKLSKLTEEETIAVIQSEVKKRKESIEAFEKGGRKELAAKETAELKILMAYLPEQLSEDEIKKIAQEVIKTTGATSKAEMGRIMKEVMQRVKGRADGQMVSRVVQELLR